MGEVGNLSRGTITNELIWTAIYVGVLLGTVIPIRKLEDNFITIINPYLIMFAMLLLTVAFGALIGLPSLIRRWSEDRGFNWAKFLIQGVPALILAIPIFLVMGVLGITEISSHYIPWWKLQHMGYNGYVFYLSGVWFGKTLIDCIKGMEK